MSQKPAVPTQRPTPLVPDWLGNLAALSWRILVVMAFLVVLWFAATAIWTVTASILVAIVVAAVFAPFVLRLRARGRSRNAAAGIVWLTAILVIGALLLALVLALLPAVVDLVSRISGGIDELQAQLASIDAPAWISTLAQDIFDKVQESGGGLVGSIVASAASAITVLILATFLLFFFLRDGDKAWLWCFQSLGQDKLELITTAGDDALARVGGYLRGTTVLAAIMAGTNYLFMLALGIPLAIPLAILSFAATYIPYFGGLIVTISILLVTLGSAGVGTAVLMLVLMGIRGVAVGYFVRPMIYQRTVSIHPAVVLLVLPAGFQIGGIVGLFAAVPVTAVALAVARAAITIIQPDPAPVLPDLVPAWLDRAAQWSWRALVAIALVALLVLILTSVPLVILPLILALVFAATLDPLVRWLANRGRSRGSATAIAVLGSTIAIVGVLALAMASLVNQATEMGDTVVDGANSLNESAGGTLGLAADGVSFGVRATVEAILSVAGDLAALGAVFLLSVLLTFYFLRDGAGMWGRMMSRTQSSAAQELSDAGRRAFDVLGGYMIGTGAISLVGAASQLVIMVVLGLPLALPVFVLSFFGGFIPYIGSLLTTLLAFLIAVAVGEPIDVLIMGIWTIVFNLVQGNVVAPLVYGRTTHIHPAVVLVAIPAGAAVAGILGMFIVVPAIGVVATTWRTILKAMGGEDDYSEALAGAPVEPEPPDETDSPPGEATPEAI